jgi:hypothetical protein
MEDSLARGIRHRPDSEPEHPARAAAARDAGSRRASGPPAGPLRLTVTTLAQPDETTCGPTCLHAVYRYWGEDEPLAAVIARTRRLEHGGTLAVFLGCDALRKGYCASIYTYNLMVFDPTWFAGGGVRIADRLLRQRAVKPDYRLQHATAGYLEFLDLGGRLRLADLSQRLIRRILYRGIPIIAGASSTFLYRAPRERPIDDQPDDIHGFPTGHFIVVAGFDATRSRLLVVDPYEPNPYGSPHEYWIGAERVVAATLLGIVTHDANLLIVHPPPGQHPP